MRRRIGLGFAGLFLFSVTFAHAQDPAVHAPDPAVHAQDPVADALEALVPVPNPFDTFQQFSAFVSGSPLRWDKMKVYRSGKMWRGEYAFENEVRFSNLTDRNGWFIRPLAAAKSTKCGRMTLMDASSYPFFAYSDRDYIVERSSVEPSSSVANETIDGHFCKVENFKLKPKKGLPITIHVKLWEAEDLNGFPIKIEVGPSSKPKFSISYTNVSLERPDPKLFQLPAMCHAGVHGKAKPQAVAPKTPSKESPQPHK